MKTPRPLLFSLRDPSDRTWSRLGLAHHDARGLSDLTAGPRATESGQRRHGAHRAVRAARGRRLRRGDGPALFVAASLIVSTSPSRPARPGPAPSPRPRDGTEGRSRGRNRECFLTPLFQLIEEAYPAELSPPTLLDGEVEDREGHINHFVGDEKAAQDRGYVSSTCMACVTHLVELEGAMPRFCKRGAKVWAVCADSLSGFRIPLRASIGSTERSNFGSTGFGVVGPTRATRLAVPRPGRRSQQRRNSVR
jgi:hypothetical protein